MPRVSRREARRPEARRLAITLRSVPNSKEPVPRPFLQVRIEHLIPSLRIEVVGAEIEAGFAGRFTVAEAREAGAAAERDLADGGRGVAQDEAIRVEFDAGTGDFDRRGEAGNLGANVLQLRRAGDLRRSNCRPFAADHQIDRGRTYQGDFGRADANGTGKLLQAFESCVSLDVQSEALVVENSVDGGRSACAEGKVKAVHHQGANGRAGRRRNGRAVGGRAGALVVSTVATALLTARSFPSTAE